MADCTLYDDIGGGYLATRREDPRLARAIQAALGDARTVVNIGAGTGSYEPRDRRVVAVEPSQVMIGQRPPGAAPAVRAHAEALPFDDGGFDAAMAVLSDHHWHDRARGLGELRRVARRRVVVFNADPARAADFWLNRDYLPGFVRLIPDRFRAPGAWRREFERVFGSVRLQPVPIPHDCTDGFYGAYWRRPEAYLDPAVRQGTSVFARLPASDVDRGLARLRADLDSGAWRARNRELLSLEALDLGYALVIADLGPSP
jgi:SAM-dependent methyltransferase